MKKSTAVMTEPVKPTFDHLEAFEPLEEIVTTTRSIERRIIKVKARRTADAELITIEYEVAHEKAKAGSGSGYETAFSHNSDVLEAQNTAVEGL